MNENDIPDPAFHPRPRDVLVALGLLTRLPLPSSSFPTQDTRPASHAAWSYPLVGVLIGLLGAAAGWAALGMGLPAGAAALMVLLIGFLSTGAMHEDGLADCADGFWGGWTRDRRLEIMKDSQIGTYGVLALMMSVGLRWSALTAILTGDGYLAALLCAAVVSRAAMVWVMYALPHARDTGLSRHTGRPPRAPMLIALAIGVIATVGSNPAYIVGVLCAATVAAVAAALIARSKIGGQTGDVLGATQQLVEISVLLVLLVSRP